MKRKRLIYAVTRDENLPSDYDYLNDTLNERDDTPDDDVEGEDDEDFPNNHEEL